MEIGLAQTQRDFFEVVHLRIEVFVLEQQVDITIEQDDRDLDALHYLARIDNQPVGCLRILLENDQAIIGRVAVLHSWRHQGIGAALMQAAEQDPQVKQRHRIHLHAQLTARPFYEKCGYVAASEIFEEAGIQHVLMEKIV